MTRTSIWDLREMQRGPLSPRKQVSQPPPIGSPRFVRANQQNRRLSTIGRIALRERPHCGYGVTPPRIGESSSGRLWPGHFSQAANASVLDSARMGRKGADGGLQSPRALARSSSVPRAQNRNPLVSHARPPPAPGSFSASAITSSETGNSIASAGGYTHSASPESRIEYPRVVYSPSSVSAPAVSTALEADLGIDADTLEDQCRHPEPVSFAARVETALDASKRGCLHPGNAMSRAESADAVMTTQYRLPETPTPISRRPPPLEAEHYDPTPMMPFQDHECSIQDELVLYTETAPDASQLPGLGSIQPNGRAQVLQSCCSSHSRGYPAHDGSVQQRTNAPRPLEAIRPLLRQTPANSNNSDGFETEWSTLSEAARHALKQWSSGQLGGRHCMLVVEHSVGTEFGVGTDEPSASSLRSGAALNVLAGLKAEVDLFGHSEGSWLFQNVFGKQPLAVLEEAIGAALEEIADPRIDGIGGLSAEQANLALRRLAMKVQCLSPHIRPSTAGSPRISDEYLRTQVWLELLRLCVDGHKDASSSSYAKEKEKPQKGEKPLPGFNDVGVLRDLGKAEIDLETDSDKMSLDALRVQNRHIEEYVMRLVRQRDELKSLTKLAEERDSYVILGLEGPESTEEEVKKAYRSLARKEHPDKAGIGNKRRFQQIQQAYTSILRQIREGGSSSSAIAKSPGAKEGQHQKWGAPSPIVEESLVHARRARDAADRVVACAHRAMKSSEDSGEVHRDNKRRALRSLRDLTKQGIEDLRDASVQLRALGESVCGIAKCAEIAMNEQKDAGEKMVAGVGLRDRAIIVDDAGRSSATSAELLEKISEATEATLRKVEKADAPGGQDIPGLARAKRDEASQLLHLGIRLLSESLTRIAAVARRSADEAISATTKAHELSRGLAAVDLEGRKERERANAKQRGFDDDDDVVIAADDPTAASSESGAADQKKDEGDDASKRTPGSKPDAPNAQPTPRDQLKSAAKRVKERHVALRVKNLRFLASLNEESLRLQGRLREMLERSEGALLPEVSIVQKRQVFDLVAQLLDFAVAELNRIMSSPNCLSVGPIKVIERVLSFAISLEHAKEVAMPVESRTQALKIAALIDSDLLCQIIAGPLRTRLVNVTCRRNRGEGSSGPQMRLKTRNHSIGPIGGDANAKAWEEAVNSCCSRVVACVRSLTVAEPAVVEVDTNP